MRSYLALTLLGIPVLAHASPTSPQHVHLEPRQGANGSCESLPPGQGPMPEIDDVYSFKNFAEFSNFAKNATTPANYTESFNDLQASSSVEGSYLTYSTLDSYDANECAASCNNHTGCEAFNIYFERQPSEDVGEDCPNPPASTAIKCVLWAGEVNKENTNNNGTTTYGFTIIIAGSNGYNKGEGKKGASPKNFSTPTFALLVGLLLAVTL